METLGDILDWGTAGAPIAGETSSGDLAVVQPFPGGALIALIDGLGHGPEAAVAAHEAARLLRGDPGQRVDALIKRCHDGLRQTRGAAISMASIDVASGSLEWVGVGNVDGSVIRAPGSGQLDDGLASRGGTVGYLLPPLRARTIALGRGDLIVFATDGVRSGFRAAIASGAPVHQIAAAIIELYRRPTDDSCVVVARYRGR